MLQGFELTPRPILMVEHFDEQVLSRSIPARFCARFQAMLYELGRHSGDRPNDSTCYSDQRDFDILAHVCCRRIRPRLEV